jgi:Golgi phosphoprotein 3 (GPP34)
MGPLLAEELLLLAHSASGRPLIGEGVLERGVAGGLLTDLAIMGRIGCGGSLVAAMDPAAVGHEPLDTVLQQIVATSPGQRPRWWVDKLAAQGWRRQLVSQMFKHGTWRIPVPRTELLARLTDALRSDGEPEAHTAALAALADACLLSREVPGLDHFPGLDQRRFKRNLAAMSAGQWAVAGVRKAVHAAETKRRAAGIAARVVSVFLDDLG